MTKIEKLLAWPIAGNYHDDKPLFDYAHEIIVDETQPLADRYRALWCVDRAMGITTEVSGALDLTDPHACRVALHDYLQGTC